MYIAQNKPLIPSQQAAANEVIRLIKEGHKRIIIDGSAGTGKTFMANKLIEMIKKEIYPYGAINVTAPTHKALSVLKTKIEPKPYNIFQTIFSALKMQRKIDTRTGKEIFVVSKYNPKYPPLQGIKVVILDESSMVSTALMFAKGGIHEYPGMLFIFLGDRKQLPPIGEAISPIFTQGWPEVKLTEIVRQGEGSPIIELSNNLPLIYTREANINSKGEGYFFEINRDLIVDKLAQVNGTDEMKFVSYTNKEVDEINFLTRQRIYGDPSRVELGESLIFASPFTSGMDMGYNTSQEIKVKKVEVKEKSIILPTAESEIIYENGEARIRQKNGTTSDTVRIKSYMINEHIPVLHEDAQDMFDAMLGEVVLMCQTGRMKWPMKYAFEEQLAWIGYNHGLTVHKSQGSTFQTTIVNVGDIATNRSPTEKEMMMYTAVTRSAQKLVLFNV